jgi:hypothetical protein
MKEGVSDLGDRAPAPPAPPGRRDGPAAKEIPSPAPIGSR